jgi:OmpA-OmpF porin, OOP family
MDESVKLIQNMEAGRPVGVETPLVNSAAKLRPDLWDAAAKLKGHPGWRCAEQKTACAEVELVHAGNEFNQQQWRHAKPYVQIAEDLIGDAQKAAEACIPAPAVAAVVPVAPLPGVTPPVAPRVVPTAPVPVAEFPVNLAATVLFNFDKRDMPNVRPYTKDNLDSLISQVKNSAVRVTGIKLIGHADRLNSTGKTEYNVDLSRDRVSTIRAYMEQNGVPANLISTEYKSDSQQIEACTRNKFRSNFELQECLLPNRRVEVVVTGVRKP